MFTLLFVDDSVEDLERYRSLFQRDPYSSYFAENPEEALNIIESVHPDIIVSDLHIPGISAVDFLEDAVNIAPESLTIALSGHTDKGDVVDALNRGNIWRYIEKPCLSETLTHLISAACDIINANRQRDRLTEELMEKNLQLQKLNGQLERSVAERTALLYDKNRILHQIVSRSEMVFLFNELAEVIFKRVSTKNIIFRSPYLERDIFVNSHEGWHSGEIRQVLYPVRCETKEVLVEVVADIYVTSVDQSPEYTFASLVSDFSDLIIMIIEQQKAIILLPSLVADMESILGTL